MVEFISSAVIILKKMNYFAQVSYFDCTFERAKENNRVFCYVNHNKKRTQSIIIRNSPPHELVISAWLNNNVRRVECFAEKARRRTTATVLISTEINTLLQAI